MKPKRDKRREGNLRSERSIKDHLEIKFSILSDSVPDAMIIVDESGRIGLINARAKRLFGYGEDELTGQDIEMLIDFDHESTGRELWRDLLDTSKTGLKLTGRRKGGEEFPVEISSSRLMVDGEALVWISVRDITGWKTDENALKITQAYTRRLIEAALNPLVTISPEGKITDVNGNVLDPEAAARDITALKHAEEKIRKIHAYTRSLIETSLDPQIIKGPDGRIMDVNEATVQITGVPRDKLIGAHFPDYFTEPERAEEAYHQAFNQEVVRNYPLAIRHVSGKVTDVLYNATVYKDEKGEIQGVFASVRDITDIKQAEEALKKQQVYTRSLIEASLDPMVAISPEGKITDVNEASVKVTGVSREKLIGTDFSEYFTEPDKARSVYQQVFARGYVADYPLTIRHNLREVLYNASVYRDEDNNVLGVFATARDITAYRKQEIKIKALNEELEQRIIELESFSYSVSHDLRAPLRGIDGFIAIFLKKYYDQVDSEGRRLLNNVRRNVDKMGSLIDELLTLSRIGMKDIRVTTINMDELVKVVIEELYEMRGEAEVIVGRLGKTNGDITLIKQVLINLISNAFKYSKKKEKPRIEIGSGLRNGERYYYVKDNGIGFDMSYSNKLFGVFQRLHDPTEYQGTGVGLAIVKRIVMRHGGRVWAEGKENVGATFYFSLKPK